MIKIEIIVTDEGRFSINSNGASHDTMLAWLERAKATIIAKDLQPTIVPVRAANLPSALRNGG